jgi:hypothetical protein
MDTGIDGGHAREYGTTAVTTGTVAQQATYRATPPTAGSAPRTAPSGRAIAGCRPDVTSAPSVAHPPQGRPSPGGVR